MIMYISRHYSSTQHYPRLSIANLKRKYVFLQNGDSINLRFKHYLCTMKRMIILIFLLISSMSASSTATSDEIKFEEQDKVIYHEIVGKLLSIAHYDKNEIIVKVAKEFLGTKYVAGTLEIVPEQLSISLQRTDCILFVESCLAMTLQLSNYNKTKEIPTFEEYCDIIRSMRYRNGIVDGYSSRIHYTSEWILQNEKAGILQEYTSKIGNPAPQLFSFMSAHPESYKQLKDNPEETRKIKEVEQRLNRETKIYTISASQIGNYSQEINDGDIICFVSTVKGLDISHVGIAYHDNGKLTFIHASSKAGKVIIEPSSLIEYTKKRHLRLLHII